MEIAVTRKYGAKLPFADSFLLGVIVVSIWTKTISAWNRSTNKFETVVKRLIANACDAVRDRHSFQVTAAGERPLANACDAARYCYACKLLITIKCILADGCYAIRDNKFCYERSI